MKRVLVLVLAMFFAFNINALACDKKYLVKNVTPSGIGEEIGCTSDYEEAKKMMREYPSDSLNVASIYENNVLINSRYAVVDFSGRSSLTNLYSNETLSGYRYSYIDGNWGADGAFIDYFSNSTKKTVKVKISGLTAWVSSSNATIIPISTLYAKTFTTNRNVKIRSSATTSGDNHITTVSANTVWNYVETVEADGYLWYKINYNGEYAYMAGKQLSTGTTYGTANDTYSFKTYYLVNSAGTLVHYYRKNGTSQISIALGPAPSYLEKGIKYYSFDGNYFYTNLENMLDDYYLGTYKKAVNADTPFFMYYMYLPTHNKSGYTAADFDQIIINRGYTKAPDPNVTYYDLESGWTSADRKGVSALYGSGKYFIQAQDTYGVNALLMFGTAVNESGTGTSALALFKNNLFGQAAYDSCPISCATTFNSIYDSIVGHAQTTGSSYANPTKQYYYGSFYGNKGSGFGVNYASDPYWGEKTARLAYQNDISFGGQDYNSNTLGIKLSNEAIPMKKSPSETSDTIYLLKNNKNNHLVTNMSYIVTEKVENELGENWYKVYADSALDSKQNLTTNNYQFDYSYGYLKADYIYLANNTETFIDVSDMSIGRGETIDLRSIAKAIDKEDGDITSKLEIDGEVDSNVVGEYKITYSITDSQRLKVSRDIIITVLPSEAPIIEANDFEIKQYKNVNLKDYAKVYDTYGNLMSNFEITENNVDINKPGVYSVTYKATYQSLSITKKVNVTVLKDELPVITATNRTVKINEKVDLKTGVSAVDIEDGNLTSKITYIGSVDTTKKGEYKVTYSVTDSAKQTVTKEITIKVEEIEYKNVATDFYFNELSFKNNQLNISGYLALKGMNNTKNENITYDLVIRDNETQADYILGLERYLDAPDRHYKDSKYNYSATWFKGSVSLKEIPHGEYTLYIRARLNNYEGISLFRNVLGKEMTTKAVENERGYLFRNNNYLDEYPIELFVFSNGLISTKEKPTQANMINNFKTLSLDKSILEIKGNSYNIGVDYSSKVDVKRNIIFENKATHERYIYNLGAMVGTEIPLNVSDGFSKVKGWFNNKIDIKELTTGEYIIYIETISGIYDDFGELNDIFIKDLSQVTSTFDSKKVTFKNNKNNRFRIEMKIEKI